MMLENTADFADDVELIRKANNNLLASWDGREEQGQTFVHSSIIGSSILLYSSIRNDTDYLKKLNNITVVFTMATF